ncbi:hypothetical protein Tco_0170809 [Tanacetum coccineum]
MPIMADKVHQEKLQALQTCLTYGECSHRNSQVQHSESESYDRKKRPKKRRQSPVTADREYILQVKAEKGQDNPPKKPGERYSVH